MSDTVSHVVVKGRGRKEAYGNASEAGVGYKVLAENQTGMTALNAQESAAWPFTPLEWPLVAGASGVGHMVEVRSEGVLWSRVEGRD